MPRIAFVGDPNDNHSGPDALIVWGVAFKKGEMTEVSPEVLKKAAAHSHFRVEVDAPVQPPVMAKKGRK